MPGLGRIVMLWIVDLERTINGNIGILHDRKFSEFASYNYKNLVLIIKQYDIVLNFMSPLVKLKVTSCSC
jgi:hypothetical protein